MFFMLMPEEQEVRAAYFHVRVAKKLFLNE